MIWIILIVIVVLALLGVLLSFLLPIISGFCAKEMSSAVFVGGRTIESVHKLDIKPFPLNLASVQVNKAEKSVTATVAGLARQTAIYREGLGCTLLVGTQAETLRGLEFRQVPIIPENPENILWPTGDAFPEQEPAVYDSNALESAIQWTLSNPNPGKPHNTQAVAVVYKGQLIAEKFGPGITASTRLPGWSMTKSITNALVGILVGEGKLDPKAPTGLQEWQKSGDPRSQITLNHLLQMNSGLRWEEEYGRVSDVVRMLFHRPSKAEYAIGKKAAKPPGTTWKYSSGTTNIVGMMIRRLFTSEQAYLQFPRERLFNPIGMRSAILEPDAKEHYVWSSYCFATARDWMRFGLLYLQDGIWEGERILPEGWVKYSATPAPNAPLGEYGAHFWLNAGPKGNPSQRLMPDAPADTYLAEGFNGQGLFIIPSKELVVLRLGVSKKGHFDNNEFLKRVLKAFPGE